MSDETNDEIVYLNRFGASSLLAILRLPSNKYTLNILGSLTFKVKIKLSGLVKVQYLSWSRKNLFQDKSLL